MSVFHEGIDGMVAIDCETTGLDTKKDKILSFGFCADFDITDDDECSGEILINWGEPIPAEAQAIHGITEERCEAEGLEPEEAIEKIRDIISKAPLVVTYNGAKFDIPMLKRLIPDLEELNQHHGRKLRWVDTFADFFWRKDVFGAWPGRRRLKDAVTVTDMVLCGGDPPRVKWHSAEVDARALYQAVEDVILHHPLGGWLSGEEQDAFQLERDINTFMDGYILTSALLAYIKDRAKADDKFALPGWAFKRSSHIRKSKKIPADFKVPEHWIVESEVHKVIMEKL